MKYEKRIIQEAMNILEWGVDSFNNYKKNHFANFQIYFTKILIKKWIDLKKYFPKIFIDNYKLINGQI